MGCGVSKTDTPLSVVPRMATARLPFGYSRMSAGTVGPLRPPAMGVALLIFDHKELTFFYEIIFSSAIMNTTSGGVLLPIVSAACCSAGILQWFPALSFCYRFPSLSLCLSCSMAAWLMAFNTSPHLYAISCLVVCTSSRLSGKQISSSSINKRRGVSKISPWSPQFVYISFILLFSFYLAPAILRAPSSCLKSNILAAGNNRRSLLPSNWKSNSFMNVFFTFGPVVQP